MRTKLLGSISLLTIVAGTGAATAADLAKPVYKAPPPPVAISDWAGFYIGVNGGGGWANDHDGVAPGHTGSGGVGGGQAGYNWQFGNIVAGVEGDFDGAGLSARTGNFKQTTDELASARARFGYVFAPNLLAYGTGGFGWGHSKVEDMTRQFPTNSFSQPGWIAGGGLEYKVWGPLIARGEYLHYGLNSETEPNFGTVKEQVDVVRGGLSYKF